ncbi:MAG: class I SAM-dependent methyltransferase [Armatimonadetes bacterium]|nr:class I SAM-dependent methyltransferase [Armatimonadota bacterium]
MPDLHFTLMAFCFAIRDRVRRPADVLTRLPLMPGQVVLDFGCGPGSYSVAAARLVGPEGWVYAVDRNPSAIRCVTQKAARRGPPNLTGICTDCDTRLDDSSVDVVLLYDTLHELAGTAKVVKELHRVLKFDGLLSVGDHHFTEQEIVDELTREGLFAATGRNGRTISFRKCER